MGRSLAANKRHGLRRSQEDKRRAIKRALKGWGTDKSDREIARHVGCDHKTVGKYRDEQEATGEIPQSYERTGADGRTIDTSNIGGTTRQQEPEPHQPSEHGQETVGNADAAPKGADSDLVHKSAGNGTSTDEREPIAEHA